jgi:serine/threonine-protein kinase RsbW
MDAAEAMRLANTPASTRARPSRVLEFESRSRPSAISRIRARVRRLASALPFTLEELDDICIAVGEACTNAVKHGHNPFNPVMRVRMEISSDALWVFVSDSGPGFDPASACPPCDGDLCECGRGIMCMRGLMDEVAFRSLRPGTRVELVKYVKAKQA